MNALATVSDLKPSRYHDPIDVVEHFAGPEAAMIVAQKLGGRDIWLPVEPLDSSLLSDLLGIELTRKVALAIGPVENGSDGCLGVSVLIPGNRRCLSMDQVRTALSGRDDEIVAERLGINEITLPAWRDLFAKHRASSYSDDDEED